MKFLGITFGLAFYFALMGFVLATLVVLLGSFIDWQWVGYNWPLTRGIVGVMFIVGLAIGLASAGDEIS